MVGEEEQTEITKSQIQTDVELRLRKAGLIVDATSVSALRVLLMIHKTPVLSAVPNDPVVVNFSIVLNIRLVQRLQLLRNPALLVNAGTWESMNLSVIRQGQLKEVRDDVNDMVDRFINDYLAANPRQ
jgi:hypothetical protein